MKRRVIIATVGFLLLVLITGIAIYTDREPTYAGRSLSQWLTQYERGSHRPNDPQLSEAEQAVGHIGSKALPTLLRWLREETPAKWKQNIISALHNMGAQTLARRLALTPTFSGPRTSYQTLAVYGFLILGPQAKPAIPELLRLAHVPRIGSRACFALSRIGSDALPPLLALAAEEPAASRANVIPTIASMTELEVDLRPAVPVLIQALSDPDYGPIATNALLKIAPEVLTNHPPH
jgi:hypothetical protein